MNIMNTDSTKVPVEYTISTTSDWTEFQIVEGGWWEDLQIECTKGASKLIKPIQYDNKTIYLEKKDYDESPVIVHVTGILNFNKETKQPNIKYKILKGDVQATVVAISTYRKKLLPLVHAGSSLFDSENPQTFDCSIEDYLRDLTKEKVFIIHGHDEHQLFRLKDFLHKQHVNTFTLEDLAHNGKTIIEQLEYAMKNASYAIAILTPDDIGCSKNSVTQISGMKVSPTERLTRMSEELKGRARQNVLFELGLFIGALGKENICYLKQRGLTDIFSDVHGVLYIEFDQKIDEAFTKMREQLFPE